jgi:hypothetical protein
VPVLPEDRVNVRAIHTLKVEKYSVPRGTAAIGLHVSYASEARERPSLHLDACPGRVNGASSWSGEPRERCPLYS